VDELIDLLRITFLGAVSLILTRLEAPNKHISMPQIIGTTRPHLQQPPSDYNNPVSERCSAASARL